MKISPGSPSGYNAHGDVAFVASDGELVRDRRALLVAGDDEPHSADDRHQLIDWASEASRLRPAAPRILGGFGGLGSGSGERLRLLASIAIDGDGLQSETPGLHVGIGDIVDRCILGQVDGLGDGAGDEGLRGGHHLQMSHVGDGARALGGLEGAIEDGEMLFLDVRRAFDGAGGVDVADDGVGLVAGVAELEERGRDRVVHDLDHAAADQLLVLDEREVRLDAGCVAVHHEADGAGGREHGDLRVAISVLLAVRERFVPSGLGGFDEGLI